MLRPLPRVQRRRAAAVRLAMILASMAKNLAAVNVQSGLSWHLLKDVAGGLEGEGRWGRVFFGCDLRQGQSKVGRQMIAFLKWSKPFFLTTNSLNHARDKVVVVKTHIKKIVTKFSFIWSSFLCLIANNFYHLVSEYTVQVLPNRVFTSVIEKQEEPRRSKIFK